MVGSGEAVGEARLIRALTRVLPVIFIPLMILGLILGPATASAADFPVLPDFPTPGGHFYSQASGAGNPAGFAVVDDDSAGLFGEFTRLGGVASLGYPASQRFSYDGFVTQATQKVLLQWRPAERRAALVNVFDIFTQLGLDPELARTRLIPPTGDNSADTNLTWPEIVSRHLALLDQNPAIKAHYFADADPVDDFGLPQGSGEFGEVFVIRCERAAFQQWRVATPFARPGEVTRVNAGDLAKELGLVPAPAGVPTPTAAELVAPPGGALHVDTATLAAAREVATTARSSLVRISVTIPNGHGVASGILLDPNGDILTAEHVVDSAQTIQASFANGASAPAIVVGADATDDVAVVRVRASSIGDGVRPATFGDAADLRPGQILVALGYSPYFASPPAVRVGTFQRLVTTTVTLVQSDSYMLPGDSGGMLLDLKGQVIGLNDEISFTNQAQQPLVGLSIDAADAVEIARRLTQGGTVPAAYAGFQLITVDSEVQSSLGLPVDHGALVADVVPDGPADRAGLRHGDVIVAAAGQPIASAPDVRFLIDQKSPGDNLVLGVVGPDGPSRTVTLILDAVPANGGS